jgi:hypothetical protein
MQAMHGFNQLIELHFNVFDPSNATYRAASRNHVIEQANNSPTVFHGIGRKGFFPFLGSESPGMGLSFHVGS